MTTIAGELIMMDTADGSITADSDLDHLGGRVIDL
jgi:hypothetical protein